LPSPAATPGKTITYRREDYGLPVLLVATYRPEFQPPWVGGSQVTVVALNRLGRSDGATLVHRLAGNLGALPPDVVDEIVERTDGVPLFVEELTKAVVEAGADRGNVPISAVPPSSLAVPATLHASLVGRLDRLGPSAKTVAQAGAAIGRDFSYELRAARRARTAASAAPSRRSGKTGCGAVCQSGSHRPPHKSAPSTRAAAGERRAG
jgi:predicted ATPase